MRIDAESGGAIGKYVTAQQAYEQSMGCGFNNMQVEQPAIVSSQHLVCRLFTLNANLLMIFKWLATLFACSTLANPGDNCGCF